MMLEASGSSTIDGYALNLAPLMVSSKHERLVRNKVETLLGTVHAKWGKRMARPT